MPTESFRFAHSADLCLGGQPRDRIECDHETAGVLREATYTAWDHVVSACVDAEVDFLLITGKTFADAEPDLRTEQVLLSGLQTLTEFGIRIFIMAYDQAANTILGWIDEEFENITVFSGAVEEPVAFIRDGRVLATIAARARAYEASLPENEDRRPFRIGILQGTSSRDRDSPHLDPQQTEQGSLQQPTDASSISDMANVHGMRRKAAHAELARFIEDHAVDYLSLPSRVTPETLTSERGVAHSPGSPQGLGFARMHHGTCSLISVSESRDIRIDTRPTASVRWQDACLTMEVSSSIDQLKTQMLDAIEQFPVSEVERVRIIRWKTVCPVEWSVDSSFDQPRTAWKRLLESRSIVSKLQVLCCWKALSVAPDSADTPEVGADFTDLIQRIEKWDSQLMHRILGESDVKNEEVRSALESLVSLVDGHAIRRRLEQMGTEWFTKSTPKGAA